MPKASDLTKPARKALAGLFDYYRPTGHAAAAVTLLGLMGKDALPHFTGYFEGWPGNWQQEIEIDVLAKVVDAFGADAAPLLLRVAQGRGPKVREAAAEHFCRLEIPVSNEITAALEQGIAGPTKTATSFVRMAAAYDFPAFEAKLWELVDGKSKPVRQAAAEAVGRYSRDAVERARPMLGDSKSAVRQTAVWILGACGSDEALALLKQREEKEPSGIVRDEIQVRLRRAGRVAAPGETSPGLSSLRDRVAELCGRYKAAMPKWVKLEALPPLLYQDQTRLSSQEVAWLLHCQSREKQCRGHPEPAPVYPAIERGSGAEFALALLSECLKKPDNSKAWAFVVAALLGDERILPLLSRHMLKAAEGFNVKLGQWAVDALMLYGSDTALSAVGAFAAKYKNHSRQKHYKIGRHADEAMRAEAVRRGLTLEELADRTVPWFGFQAGRNRVLDAGRAQIEVSIGPDFKLAYRNIGTGIRVASVPKAAGPAVQAELKNAGKLLREVVKSQTERLEQAMCDQRRWAAATWRELFLAHPLLRRFAGLLVWGLYDEQDRLAATFRALEDGTLTRRDDEGIDPPERGRVGLVHPVELSESERRDWLAHLADYEVSPPFAQMNRPVTQPAGGEVRATECTRLIGRKVHAMTFRSRAERWGWHRGPLRDKSMRPTCWRSFPAHGVDAILECSSELLGFGRVEGEVVLGGLWFTRSDAFDPMQATWHGEDACLRLGEVPTIVFSEALYDANRMAAV